VPTINDLLSEIKLDELYHSSSGDPDLVIAIIDGVIDGSHSDFSSDSIKTLNDENQPSNNASCAIKDSPSCQHGTFIAGILAANRQSSAPGLCPQCTFISKPLFCESASLSQCPLVDENDLANAIRHSIKAGANIINMSVGLNSRPTALSENLSQAYNEAQKAGVLLIGASGNQASEQVNSIFQHPWVIPVAAMDPQGQIIPSSNGGPWVVEHGLMAPGNAIVSCAAGGGYQQMSGTSVAAPFVTATAALLWSQAPKADAKTIRNALLQKVSNDEHKVHSDNKLLTPKQLNGSLSLSLLRQFQSVSPQEIMPMNHLDTDTQLASSHPKTQALRKHDSQTDQDDNHNLLINKPSDITGLLLSCPLAAGNGVSGQTLTN
jgi:subtilisin family serine protease